MKKYKILFSIIIILLTGCSLDSRNKSDQDSSEANPFLQKYAGGYTIEVKGISSDDAVEAFALNQNGKATWMYIKDDVNGNPKISSKKIGTWTAQEGKISVSVQGNTGVITEEYILNDEVFVSSFSSDRYLKVTGE